MALALRPHEANSDDELVQEIIRTPGARRLCPGPLSDAAISALVCERLGEPPTARFVQACSEVTLGNPMLLRELLVELTIRKVSMSDAGIPDVRRVAPTNVARMVRQRLARLPAAAQALARAAAVLGDVPSCATPPRCAASRREKRPTRQMARPGSGCFAPDSRSASCTRSCAPRSTARRPRPSGRPSMRARPAYSTPIGRQATRWRHT